MNQVTIQLAIQALEAEKAKIDGAIAELTAGINGWRTARLRATGGGGVPSPFVAPTASGKRRRRRRISAAGRAALALAAKRRWAKAKAAGKSTL